MQADNEPIANPEPPPVARAERYSPSDKLAIALACLAGIMAIILFLVEKTRWSIILLLSAMIGLAIYPTLHFFRGNRGRVSIFILVMVGTIIFGYCHWPKEAAAAAPPQTTSTIPQKSAATTETQNQTAQTVSEQKVKSHNSQPTKSMPAPIVPPGTTITAITSAPDSIAVGINTGTINNNPDAKQPVITYFINGEERISKPGKVTSAAGESEAYKQIMDLNSRSSWTELLELCDREIARVPTWITPYYYAGLAQANTQNLDKAHELFVYVETKTTGNEDYGNLSERAKVARTKVEQFQREHGQIPKPQ